MWKLSKWRFSKCDFFFFDKLRIFAPVCKQHNRTIDFQGFNIRYRPAAASLLIDVRCVLSFLLGPKRCVQSLEVLKAFPSPGNARVYVPWNGKQYFVLLSFLLWLLFFSFSLDIVQKSGFLCTHPKCMSPRLKNLVWGEKKQNQPTFIFDGGFCQIGVATTKTKKKEENKRL